MQPILMIHFLDDDPEQKPIHNDQFLPLLFDMNPDRPKFNARRRGPVPRDALVPAPTVSSCIPPRCLLESGYHSLLAAWDVVCARLGSSPDAEAPVDATTVVHLLPAGLASLAAQPMVRGGVHGVAGNVAAVVHARRVVYASFRYRIQQIASSTR
ncbi:hypothetical protein FB451DRAFT_1380774 [Mycena latifolia]|nr:hypothetical protein FB451DRAFT_1380774 [Mycena latifolia]